MAQQPETRFRIKTVQPALEALPKSYWVKIQAGSLRGIPDILGCVNGRMVALELKTNIGRLTKLQQYRLDKFHLAGAYCGVARPSNWDRILADLRAL